MKCLEKVRQSDASSMITPPEKEGKGIHMRLWIT